MSKDKKAGISLTDLAKKIVYASLGSAAMARAVVKDAPTQKKVMDSLLNRAEKTKDDLMELLARELTKFLGKVNVADEVSKALSGMVINLNASIDFKEKKGKGVRPRATIHKADIEKK